MTLKRWFLEKIQPVLLAKENTTCVIVGAPRKGKSTWAFHLARTWKNLFGDFNESSNVHFYAKDLIKDYKVFQKTAIVLDDAGYQADPLRWYSKAAHAIKITQETQGIKLNFLIITVQSLGLLLEASTGLSTYVWVIKSKGKAHLWKVFPNLLGKGYWLQNLHWVFEFDKLTDERWIQYEAKKMDFLDKLGIDLEREVQLEDMRKEIRFISTTNRLDKLLRPIENKGEEESKPNKAEIIDKAIASTPGNKEEIINKLALQLHRGPREIRRRYELWESMKNSE